VLLEKGTANEYTGLAASGSRDVKVVVDHEAVFELYASSRKQILLGSVKVRAVTPIGEISANPRYCALRPGPQTPNPTTCSTHVTWRTGYRFQNRLFYDAQAAHAGVWVVTPEGDKQFLNKPSGDVGPNNVNWITTQGARFELVEFFNRRAVSHVLSSYQVYAVRYADAYEWDDQSRAAKPYTTIQRRHNFHSMSSSGLNPGGDEDWFSLNIRSALKRRIRTMATGSATQTRIDLYGAYETPSDARPMLNLVALGHVQGSAMGAKGGATLLVDRYSRYHNQHPKLTDLLVRITDVNKHQCPPAGNNAPKPGADYCAANSYDLLVSRAEAATNPNAIPHLGLWFDPGRPGTGFDLHRAPNGQYFLLWYTYTQSGGYPIWYLSDSATLVRGVWTAALSKYRWINGAPQATRVGRVTLEMTGSTHARFKWQLSGHSQTDDASFLFGGGNGTGLYFPPSESGWGLSVQANGISTVTYLYLYDGTEPRWVSGSRSGLPNDGQTIQYSRYIGAGLCPWCSGGTARAASIGTINLAVRRSSGWITTRLTLRSGQHWNRTGLNLAALTLQ